MIDPEADDVIEEIIFKMEKWFGKPKLDEACDAWRDFIALKREESDPVDEFLLKFETNESNLKCSATGLPKLILALQLVESMNISEDQRRNVMANVKIENHETIYDDIKTAIRLLKGSIVEGSKKENEDINYIANKNRARSRSKSRQRSKSNQRYQSRSFQNSDDEGSRGRDNYRNKRYDDRGRSKDRQNRDRKGSTDRGYRNRDRSYSRNGYNRRNDRRFEDVNLVYKEDPKVHDDVLKDIHDNLDKAVVDCGTTKTVAGKYWMDNFLEIAEKDLKENIKYRKENRFFRFGNSVRYPSRQEVSIPFKMGSLESVLHVSVVDANIPLLLGRPDLKKLGLVINFENDSVFTTKTLETFSLEKTSKGHLALPIFEVSADEAFILEEATEEEKLKKVTKIHEVMCHPKAEILKNFFKDSSDNDQETLDMIDEVSEKCEICRKFAKSPSRPKVGFPVSRDFNQCVALDLKDNKRTKSYILYCIDTFSRLTRGLIIKDKKPATIVKGIQDCWILGKGIGPGIPQQFLFDNGGEFNNRETLDLAEKNGIKLQGVTAAHSPWSNGLCEKNHHVCDRMMAKLQMSNDKLKDQEALDFALFAKNVEPNNKGFSSFQIVYGNNPTIPGVINSTPASLSTNFESADVRKHLANIDSARDAFREADNNERIKRALKSRIQSSNHEFYKHGDIVFFKEIKTSEWPGPEKVLDQDGKVVFVRYID